jgi:hypothetical protein
MGEERKSQGFGVFSGMIAWLPKISLRNGNSERSAISLLTGLHNFYQWRLI